MDTPEVSTSMPRQKPPAILCTRCHKPADGGVVVTLMGPGTGHNHERYVLCPRCKRDLALLLSTLPAADKQDKQAAAEALVESGQAQ